MGDRGPCARAPRCVEQLLLPLSSRNLHVSAPAGVGAGCTEVLCAVQQGCGEFRSSVDAKGPGAVSVDPIHARPIGSGAERICGGPRDRAKLLRLAYCGCSLPLCCARSALRRWGCGKVADAAVPVVLSQMARVDCKSPGAAGTDPEGHRRGNAEDHCAAPLFVLWESATDEVGERSGVGTACRNQWACGLFAGVDDARRTGFGLEAPTKCKLRVDGASAAAARHRARGGERSGTQLRAHAATHGAHSSGRTWCRRQEVWPWARRLVACAGRRPIRAHLAGAPQGRRGGCRDGGGARAARACGVRPAARR